MQGLKIGHFTDKNKHTGVSVFLFDKPATGAYLLCGSGPATLELAALEPDMSVSNIHGLLLTGGSAYGIYAAQGVMRYLTEKNMGIPVPHGVVPIVPCASIYDLAYKTSEPPTDKDAYTACLQAVTNNKESGRIGAGTGATIGKLIKDDFIMTGGLGRAELSLPNGVKVLAYVVVNAAGDIRDHLGRIIAGARSNNGEFVDSEAYLLSGKPAYTFLEGGNTTLAAIFTNAKFSKSELKRISKMAIAGMARAISPIFTCYDGDILFSISIGEKEASVLSVGVIAAEAVRCAIIDAVKHSERIA